MNVYFSQYRGQGFFLTTLPRVAVHDWLLVNLSSSSQRKGSEEKSGSENLIHPRRARSRKGPGFTVYAAPTGAVA